MASLRTSEQKISALSDVEVALQEAIKRKRDDYIYRGSLLRRPPRLTLSVHKPYMVDLNTSEARSVLRTIRETVNRCDADLDFDSISDKSSVKCIIRFARPDLKKKKKRLTGRKLRYSHFN